MLHSVAIPGCNSLPFYYRLCLCSSHFRFPSSIQDLHVSLSYSSGLTSAFGMSIYTNPLSIFLFRYGAFRKYSQVHISHIIRFLIITELNEFSYFSSFPLPIGEEEAPGVLYMFRISFNDIWSINFLICLGYHSVILMTSSYT